MRLIAIFGRGILFFISIAAVSSYSSNCRAHSSVAEVVAAPAVVATCAAADNAWMLTSSALVLMMTAPGLALFYCGLVRKKNVLSVMMQCVFLMCLMTVIWAFYGYTLVFGGTAAVDRRRAATCSCTASMPCGRATRPELATVSRH